jgi:hypothetical protein
MTVNNSANIDKTIYRHSPQLTEHIQTTTYDVDNPGPDLG